MLKPVCRCVSRAPVALEEIYELLGMLATSPSDGTQPPFTDGQHDPFLSLGGAAPSMVLEDTVEVNPRGALQLKEAQGAAFCSFHKRLERRTLRFQGATPKTLAAAGHRAPAREA